MRFTNVESISMTLTTAGLPSSVGCELDTRWISHSSESLLSADANAVAAPAAPATLHQAFGRARTVIDGQQLGLPGQKIAGHATAPGGRLVQLFVVFRFVDGDWNAIFPDYSPRARLKERTPASVSRVHIALLAWNTFYEYLASLELVVSQNRREFYDKDIFPRERVGFSPRASSCGAFEAGEVSNLKKFQTTDQTRSNVYPLDWKDFTRV